MKYIAFTAFETASICHGFIVSPSILLDSGTGHKYKTGTRDERYIFTYEH
jgi:hypothetical protein